MIVDANNQFLRSYIVDPSMSSMGNPIGGTKGFLKILNKLCREINPDLVCIVWDGAGGSRKRRAINKSYKDGRKPPRPRLNRNNIRLNEAQEKENRFWQQAKVIEILNHMPIMQFLEDEVEADDVISYVQSLPKFADYQKVIISSDKDFIQLLDSSTVLFRPTQSEVLNSKRVVDKFDIHPSNFALARSIVGDKSDNLPGIRGAGIKTVAKTFPFLSEENSYYIDDLYNHVIGLEKKSKFCDDLLDSRELVESNYKIMQLYSPLMSASMKNKVSFVVDEWVPQFDKTSIRKEMMKEGFGEVNLSCLFETLNSIVSNFSIPK